MKNNQSDPQFLVERLTNQYMLKSPAAVAMRKSQMRNNVGNNQAPHGGGKLN
jgi:hypothetical protein